MILGDFYDKPKQKIEQSTSEREYTNNAQQKQETTQWGEIKDFYQRKGLKIMVVAAIFFIFILVKMSNFISDAEYDKPKDRVHDATEKINLFINQNLSIAHLWQIIASLIMDSMFLLLWSMFILKSKSYRTLVSIAIFYLIRAILQLLQTMPFPEGSYWLSPGFPSLINIYGRQSDFFYSGHTGFMILCTIELFAVGGKRLGAYSLFGTLFVVFTLLCFRVHYTIDIFAGAIMAHYWYYLTGFIINPIDEKMINCKEFAALDKTSEQPSSDQIV